MLLYVWYKNVFKTLYLGEKINIWLKIQIFTKKVNKFKN